jgi:hypothetical protein
VVGDASIRGNEMEIGIKTAREQLGECLFKRYADEQTRQFIYSLKEQGLNDAEIEESFERINQELAISGEGADHHE